MFKKNNEKGEFFHTRKIRILELIKNLEMRGKDIILTTFRQTSPPQEDFAM